MLSRSVAPISLCEVLLLAGQLQRTGSRQVPPPPKAPLASQSPQTATDVVLATYNTGMGGPRFSFQATREPHATGAATIRISMRCGSAPIGIRCELDEGQVRRAFLHYVATRQDVLTGLMRPNDFVR